MNFSEVLSTKTAEVEEVIRSFLPREEGLQNRVIEAMNYSVLAGGKRLRPLLMLETYRLFGGQGEVIRPFMAALEMIHTYSLVHDDLPAMDNDLYRRGKKTTHAVYGEAMGILAGDALLNYAFETALTALSLETGPRVAKALQILAGKAGIYGMIGGQVVDVESEQKGLASADDQTSSLNQVSCNSYEEELNRLIFIHKNKTAAMIESAMEIGAVLAGASEEDRENVRQIAENIGLAFQIRDDILDVTSTTEVLGKPVGSDARNRKLTYVSLKGLDASGEEVRRLSERALSILDGLPGDSTFLHKLIDYLISRNT